jgi:SNF2 family DNA or RNA helicase
MGVGKTKAALWSWRYLNRMGVANKLLIVAPLSTLKFTWLREIHTTLPGVKAVVLHGGRKKRQKLLLDNPDAQIFIINHDGLKVLINELFYATEIDTLVLDELAAYRNNSQRSKVMREFAKKFRWAWGMSGRPMPNAPTDCWAQCKILTPHTVPKYFRHARTALMTQISQFKWVSKPDAVEQAMKWMQPNVRYSLDDVVELPPAITRMIDVDLSEEQKRAYTKLSNEFVLMLQEKVITAANAGVALGKLLQVGAGYVYSTNPLYVTLNSEPRQEALLEILNEAPFKTIVFTPWRHLIDNLSVLLQQNDIDHAMVHGDTPKREEVFNAFQNTNKYRVLLAHPQTLAHGLTLTAATTCVWYSPVASLEIYEQANARIRRVGQQHKTQFFHLQSTAVERRMYALLRKKQKLQDEFLALIKAATETDDDTAEDEWWDTH